MSINRVKSYITGKPTAFPLTWTFNDARDQDIAATTLWWTEAVMSCPQCELSKFEMYELESQWDRANKMFEAIASDKCKGR